MQSFSYYLKPIRWPVRGSLNSLFVIFAVLMAATSGFTVVAHSQLTIAVVALPTIAIVILGVLTRSRVALARSAFDTCTAVTFCSLFVVRWEPAPFDILICLVLFWGIVGTRFKLPRTGAFTIFACSAFFLLISQYLSTFKSPSLATSLFFGSVTVLMLLIALASYLIALDEDLFRRVISAFLLGATVSTTVILALVLSGVDSGQFFVRFGSRITGLFKDPNVFAPYLVMAFVFSLAFVPGLGISFSESRHLTLLNAIALAVFSLGVLLAYSRAGWMHLAISAMIYWFLRSIASPKNLVRSIVAIALLLPAVLFAISRADLPDDSLLGRRLQLQQYDEDRFATQVQSLELFWNAPILGHGPGMTNTLLEYATHNSYIRLLYENGIVGFMPFAVLLLGALAFSFAASQRAESVFHRRMAAAICAVLVGAAVSSFVIDSIHWRHLWLLVGLGWATTSWQRSTQGTVQTGTSIGSG